MSCYLRMKLCSLFFVGFFGIGVVGRAATVLDPADAAVTDQQYQDLGAEFTAVGQVIGSGFSGSGTYIGGRWVLTAGHVAAGKVGGTFTLGGSTYSIVRAIPHPDWRQFSDASDIGLVELSIEVAGVTPALMIGLPNDQVLFGQTTTWVGFGQGGTGLTGATGLPGTLRGFTNVIDGFGPTFGLTATSMFADFDRPDGSENSIAISSPFPTILEGNVATGDSGGGVFWGGGLVGISSYRARIDAANDSDYGDLSGATRLSQFTDWVTQETDIAAVPEPSVGVLILVGVMGSGRRRRGRRG